MVLAKCNQLNDKKEKETMIFSMWKTVLPIGQRYFKTS